MERKQVEDMIRRYGIGETEDGRIYIQHPGKDIEIIKAAKAEILEYFAKKKAEKEERERKIAAIEGLKEIKEARAEWSNYHYKFNRAMESGNCNFPAKPESDPEALAVKYARAAAYLKADSYSNASNYAKADAGKNALDRIINGETHETVIAEMETEWTTAAHEAVMNS
jgi:hypothetical protein